MNPPKKIFLSPPHMDGSEQVYIANAFKNNWIAPVGPNIGAFEELIEKFLDSGVNITALNSGTAALHLALLLIGVTQGDEVLCQSLTFAASANPILYLGAIPIFIDSERDTWNISPNLLEKAIRDRIALGKKPKAIIAVHLYGMPYKIDEIRAIAEKYEIPVVEDSAEALGSEYNGIKCGNFGDIGIFSFNGNKIITTSAGGALITKSEELKKKAIYFATQARENTPHYQHSDVGYNYRMSNILAGIGRGQMEVLKDRIKARRSNFEFYRNMLGDNPNIEFLKEPKGYFSNRWLTCILTKSYDQREQIRLRLTDENIECRPLWKPLHLQPIFDKYQSFTDGTSEDIYNRGLCLPSGSSLSKNDLKRIISVISSKTEKALKYA